MYIQESDRGARDGLLSCATIVQYLRLGQALYYRAHDKIIIALRNLLFADANFFSKILMVAVLI